MREEYRNKTNHPLPISLDSGSISVPPKGYFYVDGSDIGSMDLKKKVSLGTVRKTDFVDIDYIDSDSIVSGVENIEPESVVIGVDIINSIDDSEEKVEYVNIIIESNDNSCEYDSEDYLMDSILPEDEDFNNGIGDVVEEEKMNKKRKYRKNKKSVEE